MSLDVIPIIFLVIVIIAEIIYTLCVNSLIKKHDRKIKALIEDISDLNNCVMRLSECNITIIDTVDKINKKIENKFAKTEKNNNKK